MCLVDLAFQGLYVSRIAKQAPEFASLESIEQYRVFVLCLWLLLLIGVAFTRFLACGLLGGFMLYRLACGFGRLAFHGRRIVCVSGGWLGPCGFGNAAFKSGQFLLLCVHASCTP